MFIKGCLVRINFDQQEQGGVARILIYVEAVAARFLVKAGACMLQQTIAKRFGDVLANPKVSRVEDRHAVTLRRPHQGCG